MVGVSPDYSGGGTSRNRAASQYFWALGVCRSLFLLLRVVRVGAAERPWNVVLKVLARTAGQDDPARIEYWRRELLLYRSGLLDDLPPAVDLAVRHRGATHRCTPSGAA